MSLLQQSRAIPQGDLRYKVGKSLMFDRTRNEFLKQK